MHDPFHMPADSAMSVVSFLITADISAFFLAADDPVKVRVFRNININSLLPGSKYAELLEERYEFQPDAAILLFPREREDLKSLFAVILLQAHFRAGRIPVLQKKKNAALRHGIIDAVYKFIRRIAAHGNPAHF